MNAEELFEKLCERDMYGYGYGLVETSPLAQEVKKLLIEALSDKVIITKGENRHPYADVFHEIAENTALVLESNRFSNSFSKDDCIVVNGTGVEILKYRIKPTEPIWEWQWYRVDGCDILEWTGHWRTDDEMFEFPYNEQQWYKAEPTKRERK